MNRYGTATSEPSVRSARERIYGSATSGRDGRRALAGILLAVSVFFLVGAISFRQVTEPQYAQDVLKSGIAVTTDIDSIIAENHDALRQLVEASPTATFTIPDYPLDIVLTRDEITRSDDTQLRDLVLQRSAALVYAEGFAAFDRTGNQQVSRFSSQGGLEFAVGQVSEDSHASANLLAIVLVFATAVSACFLLLVGHGWGRLRSLGFAVLAGAIPGLIFTGLARLLADSAGGSDPFVADLRSIVRTTLNVPLRNYVVVVVLGALLTATGVLFGMLESRIGGPAGDEVDDYIA